MKAREGKSVPVVAMVMAGGVGSRLSVLSAKRAKPAVPFGGIYRIIDFTMSNVLRSQIPVVGICTQYKPYSLMDHLSIGEAWGFTRRGHVAKILPPYTGEEDSDWYAGTADAIYQNLEFIQRYQPRIVLILSGDHIYQMDYRTLIACHLDHHAALTIACQEVPLEEASRFGIVVTDADGRVTGFQEKPKDAPKSNLANLGIYVFDADILADRLRADVRRRDSTHDFGRDVIPAMAESYRCYAYRFSGYWRDVGTVQSYWEAHMEMLNPRSELEISRWNVMTATKNLSPSLLVPARVHRGACVQQSVISSGCQVEGHVRRSVLSPGTVVRPGASVETSVLLNGVTIERDCTVRNAVIDKYTRIHERCVIGAEEDDKRGGTNDTPLITLVGKHAELPADYVVYSGATIGFGADSFSLPPSPLRPDGT